MFQVKHLNTTKFQSSDETAAPVFFSSPFEPTDSLDLSRNNPELPGKHHNIPKCPSQSVPLRLFNLAFHMPPALWFC